mmetsp:Transcript_4565/g.10750  ORF Transcript_4565/g.10750 Transcript_4565/m.10750 type:complete len:198 (-) Transcript_4565:9-602(-)
MGFRLKEQRALQKKQNSLMEVGEQPRESKGQSRASKKRKKKRGADAPKVQQEGEEKVLAEADGGRSEFRVRLERFYNEHDPTKLPTIIPSLLEKISKDKETELFDVLELKYGPESGQGSLGSGPQVAGLTASAEKDDPQDRNGKRRPEAKGNKQRKRNAEMSEVNFSSGEMGDLEALNAMNVGAFIEKVRSGKRTRR